MTAPILLNPPSKPLRAAWWRILAHAHPQEYEAQLAATITQPREINQALMLPLVMVKEQVLLALPHKIDAAPGFTRDERLKSWFQACTSLGAQPLESMVACAAHASPGLTRLMKMRSYETLKWWRAQGVEYKFQGPDVLKGDPTTVATLAFVQGHPEAVSALLPNSHLTHIEQLWGLAWKPKSVNHVKTLLDILWNYGPPPPHALNGLASAQVNKKNIEPVLAAATRLLEAGASVRGVGLNSLRPPLTMAIMNMKSPAGVDLVRFFLAHGADPLEAVRTPGAPLSNTPPFPLDVALQSWVDCSVHSHMRRALWESFEAMAQVCLPQALQALYPSTRRDQMISRLREKAANPNLSFGKPYPKGVLEEDISKMQAFWLSMDNVLSPQALPRRTARL